MEKEKIIVVFITRKNEDMIDGFNKTWVREFANIEKAKKGILKMTKYAWVVGRIYKGKRISQKLFNKKKQP